MSFPAINPTSYNMLTTNFTSPSSNSPMRDMNFNTNLSNMPSNIGSVDRPFKTK